MGPEIDRLLAMHSKLVMSLFLAIIDALVIGFNIYALTRIDLW